MNEDIDFGQVKCLKEEGKLGSDWWERIKRQLSISVAEALKRFKIPTNNCLLLSVSLSSLVLEGSIGEDCKSGRFWNEEIEWMSQELSKRSPCEEDRVVGVQF